MTEQYKPCLREVVHSIDSDVTDSIVTERCAELTDTEYKIDDNTIETTVRCNRQGCKMWSVLLERILPDGESEMQVSRTRKITHHRPTASAIPGLR
jgi:hypothetical protein